MDLDGVESWNSERFDSSIYPPTRKKDNMFWKYDDEEEKVVPRGQAMLTPSEYAKRAREAGHASFVHGLDEEIKKESLMN
jgi:hypothetical protein